MKIIACSRKLLSGKTITQASVFSKVVQKATKRAVTYSNALIRNTFSVFKSMKDYDWFIWVKIRNEKVRLYLALHTVVSHKTKFPASPYAH